MGRRSRTAIIADLRERVKSLTAELRERSVSLRTSRQQEVYDLYRIGQSDIAIGKTLGFTRERARQIRNRLGLPKLSRAKPRGNCRTCGQLISFTKSLGAYYCNQQCQNYGESLRHATYVCPLCKQPAKCRGAFKGIRYYKCRAGHWLRRSENRLVPTRSEVARQQKILDSIRTTLAGAC